jgi:hypothetical protein
MLTLIYFIITTKDACDLSKKIKGFLIAYDVNNKNIIA